MDTCYIQSLLSRQASEPGQGSGTRETVYPLVRMVLECLRLIVLRLDELSAAASRIV